MMGAAGRSRGVIPATAGARKVLRIYGGCGIEAPSGSRERHA